MRYLISSVLFLLSIDSIAQVLEVQSRDKLFSVKNNNAEIVECLLKNQQLYAGKTLSRSKFLSQEKSLRKFERRLFKKAKKAKSSGRHGKFYEKLVRISARYNSNFKACSDGLGGTKKQANRSLSVAKVFNLSKTKRPAIWMECSAATDKSHYGVNSPIVFARSGYTKGAANIRILHPICKDGPMTASALKNWAAENLKDPKVDGIGIDHEGWLWAGGEATLKLLYDEATSYGKAFISIPKITLELSGRLMPGQSNFGTTARLLNKYTHGASPWCYSCDNVEYSKFVKLWRASGYTKELLPMGDPGIRPYYGGIDKSMAVKNVNTVADLGLGWALFLPNYDDGTILGVMKKRYGYFSETNTTDNTGSNSQSTDSQSQSSQNSSNQSSGTAGTTGSSSGGENTNTGTSGSSAEKKPLSSDAICKVVSKATGKVCQAKGYNSYIQKQSIKGYSYESFIYDITYLSYKNSAGKVCRDSCVGKVR